MLAVTNQHINESLTIQEPAARTTSPVLAAQLVFRALIAADFILIVPIKPNLNETGSGYFLRALYVFMLFIS